MCGIFCCFNSQQDVTSLRPKCVAMSKKLRHRGPDWSGTFVGKESILCHERLAIVGVDTGAQPLISTDGDLALAVNGEIYNHLTLRKGLKNKEAKFRTHSDCEVILHLYKEHDTGVCAMLDGMFSFVLLDQSVTPSRLIATRDPIGITTLYQGHNSARPETQYFASEMKALQEECDVIRSFPPGCFWDSKTGETTRYYKPKWWNGDSGSEADVPKTDVDYKLIRETLEMAVKKRLMSEVPYGVLLSGGLDSSLIASIAARETDKLAKEMMRKREEGMKAGAGSVGSGSEDHALAFWPQLHSFAIGLENAPDLIAARKAAQFLGTIHHEYTFTIDEALDSLSEIVWHLETYDVTTVRASTPMGLLSRKIKAMGVKMVLSGEGSDEIFGGYLYFHLAKNGPEFHSECVQRIKNLNFADCLRANKSTMAFGLEARVPFLDKEFLGVAMNIDPKHKMFSKGSGQEFDKDGKPRIEKYILRKAFDCDAPDGRPWLDESILWRQKEQFSDGVGYSWIDSLKAHAEKLVSDEKLASAGERWNVDTPTTKEAYMIRELFDHHFPGKAPASTVVRWIPKASWGAAEDPSGRAVAIHAAAL